MNRAVSRILNVHKPIDVASFTVISCSNVFSRSISQTLHLLFHAETEIKVYPHRASAAVAAANAGL